MKKILLSILCLFSMIAVQAEVGTVTFVAEGASYSGTDETVTMTTGEIPGVTFTSNNVNFVLTKVNNSNSQVNSSLVRWYKSDIINLVPQNGAKLTKAVISVSATKYALDITASTGAATADADALTITWEGEATDTLKLTASSGQIRFSTMTVTYDVEESGATLEQPTASVEASVIYNPATIELSSAAGTIYYTTDGTVPTAESAVYSEGISISEFGTTTTIKAIAIDGDAYSDVATFSYSLKVGAPVLSVESGVYEKISYPNALKFTKTTTSSTIVYNRFGGDPKETYEREYGSLSLYSSCTFKAIAFVTTEAGDTVWSDVVTRDYTISEVKPFKAATEIVSGTKYLINAGSIVAEPLYETSNYGYLPDKEVTVNGDFIETNVHYGFTITETETEGEYTIQDTYDRYLYMAGTWNSFNVADSLTTDIVDGAIWTISIAEDDLTASIVNKSTGKTMQYSSSYTSFGAYTAIDNELPILYAEREYPTMTITPANYSTVETFSEITITCEDGIQLNEDIEAGLSPYYTIGWDWTEYYFLEGEQVDANTVRFKLETPIEANGDYNVALPAGLFTLYPDGLAISSESESVSITVENPNSFNLTYASPSNGSVVSSISSIYLEFDYDVYVAEDADLCLVNEAGETFALTSSDVDSWGDPVLSTALSLELATAITEPGVYTLTLKEGAVYGLNGETKLTMPDVTYTFTVVEGLKVASITPADGSTVESINEITVEFNKAVYHDYISALYLTDESGNEYTFNKADADGFTTTLTFTADTPITVAGTYTFEIDGYAVYCYDANWNTEYLGETQYYTFVYNGGVLSTGIDSISTEGDNNGEKVIFDLTGRRIKEITAPGIYIINGVKTIIK